MGGAKSGEGLFEEGKDGVTLDYYGMLQFPGVLASRYLWPSLAISSKRAS